MTAAGSWIGLGIGLGIDLAAAVIAAVWSIALSQWFWVARPLPGRVANRAGGAVAIGLALLFAGRAIALIAG